MTYVVLFRECLNFINNNKDGKQDSSNGKIKEENSSYTTEYTEENNAEDAPDISNEFVTDFLESDPFFFNFEREEIIDITQNFCAWLYDNNFTCSKLSLINV